MASQGVHGPRPKFLVGNLKDVAALVASSTSSDMEFISHDIVDRLLPHYVLWSKIYGAYIYTDAMRRRHRRRPLVHACSLRTYIYLYMHRRR